MGLMFHIVVVGVVLVVEKKDDMDGEKMVACIGGILHFFKDAQPTKGQGRGTGRSQQRNCPVSPPHPFGMMSPTGTSSSPPWNEAYR